MVRHEEHSVQFYQEKLEANSQSLVFSRLADCHRKKGEIQQAIGVCMQGLKIHPDYVTGRVILGRCYLEQEKLKEATAEFIRVVGLDRRNQVAIKMIADVYARQGMKEKAGDLYAYLLCMDPDNQSLAKYAQSNRGNGETNVLRILGIASQPQSAEAIGGEMPVPQASPDTIGDVDKTIQMDMVSSPAEGGAGDTAELGEMLVKTQRFDADELTASAEAGAYRVEETVSDLDAKQGDVITGDDISSRMAMIFGEEEAASAQAGLQTAEAAEAPAEAMDVVPDTTDADADAQKVHDDTVTTGSLGITETVAAPIVSGSDITSRIEQLFGDEKPSAQGGLGADAVSDFTQAYVPGAGAEEATVRVSESPSAVSVPPQAPVKEPKATDGANISGEDVTERLNEMFSDSASISEPLAEIGKMLDQQAPLVDQIEQEAAGSGVHDDLTAESANKGAGLSLDEQESSPEEPLQAVSGEDVALRLETIFEEGETGDASSDTGAITVTEDSAPRPEEDTKPPVDVSDSAIVIGGDITDSDIHEMGEATLFTAETPAEEATGHEGAVTAAEPAFDIDDAMPQETQPEMSGDDVVGRLDELFSDNLMKDAGLESIPDGDKDDDEVNQGFYTMSGENAQTAASEDGLLSELDRSDSEEPEKETLDLSSEPADKTVLMEQDDKDLTLAVAEEETILSDSRDPLPKQPVAGGGGGDDVVVNEATQISLPTADEQSQGDSTSRYSIPDHVLTPTLADIYYQQGQPALALQIYKRLLEADPDNDKIAARIQEITRAVAAQEAKETALLDSGVKRPAGIPGKAASNRKKADAGRPLAGVRIKKVYKNRIRKSR